MSFENYFPIWNELNAAQKKLISNSLSARQVKRGTIIHNGSLDCTGLLLVKSGQLQITFKRNASSATAERLFHF